MAKRRANYHAFLLSTLSSFCTKTTMDLFQRPHNTNEDHQNTSLTPASSLVQASTSIAASHTIDQEATTGGDEAATPATQTTSSVTNEHSQQVPTGSKKDRWLARAAFMLSLTKSVADAADFAPLKGACEAVVTLLDSIQVRPTIINCLHQCADGL